MPKVFLFHWKEAEIPERVERLQQAGYEVDYATDPGPALLKRLRQEKPDAFVIDLARLPSHGREVGAALRAQNATRLVPLLFVGGEAEKVKRVREVLPDAVFTTWEEIQPTLAQALINPPKEVVRLQSTMDAYGGQPLPKKLGIKAGVGLLLIDPPADFIYKLGTLPEGVHIVTGQVANLPLQKSVGNALGVWFVQTQAEMLSGIDAVLVHEQLRNLWIAWPKKDSSLKSDLAQPVVRRAGLDRDWVDYKVCAIDETWTALLFTQRKNSLH